MKPKQAKNSKKKIKYGWNKGKEYSKNISLWPLKAEEAISLIMRIDPKKLKL